MVSNTFDFGLKVLPAVADVILASIFRNRNEYDSLECVYTCRMCLFVKCLVLNAQWCDLSTFNGKIVPKYRLRYSAYEN